MMVAKIIENLTIWTFDEVKETERKGEYYFFIITAYAD